MSGSLRSQYTDIVVGAGSSGAVIAARLSERPEHRVLLIEAGPDYPEPDQWPDPLRDGRYPAIGSHDWGYRAEAAAGREIAFPRGKVVGGTSAIGGGLATRPKPADFELWSKAGNPGWSWDEVLPHYLRLENDMDYGAPYHGKGGPIPVWRWRDGQLTPQQKAFQEAARALGFPDVADHNAPGALGIGPLPQNVINGVRISTALAYLGPARGRPNLTIRPDTVADRVLFEGSRAAGVRVLTPGGGHEDVFADRVTVSAGAVATPPLLVRSGIGPAALLERLAVPLVADLPGVGENLLDHCACLLSLELRPGLHDESAPLTQLLLQFTAAGSDEFADMQIYVFSNADLDDYGHWAKEPLDADKAMMFSVDLELPRSAGRVEVRSADPLAAPRVVAGYLRHPEDLRKMREGLRLCWRLAEDPHIGLLTTGNAWPEAHVVADDAALDDFLTGTVTTRHHPVGTARMGPAGDRDAVVDERCRVHGVTGLRVADASVMPVMVRSNTNLTCIMIGERVAGWIAAEH